jgi:hypothetical protein
MKLSRLDELREAEENNYTASLERLGETASLAEDFIDAYEAVGRLLRQTKDPPDHLYVVSVLLLAARYQLERAALDVLRARITDAFQATRRAAELAAFAAKIHRHPHLSEVWLRAAKGETDYEKYRKKFSSDLFPVDDALLNRLGSRYDHGSKQFHGSPFSVGGRASVQAREGSVDFEFRTFEIDNEDDAEPASSFLWVLDTHFGILKVFLRILEAQLGQTIAGWKVRETALEAKLEAHRRKWEPVIRRRIERNLAEDAGE